uniref:glycosyltransferase family 39 protein n=1 Tax=Altererythrobacter segetis TaxID=1104773 RepID=UPI00140A0098|nr:glycosyltransferase family 39 protein [Altererythrobacter segetis]
MSQAPDHPRDPLAWNLAIALAFLVLAAIRLTIPSKPFFDEVHYLPAARTLMALSRPVNVEHPLLGKELIGLGLRLLGDNPLGWRIMPLLFGTLGLFAAMRALWFASCSRFASIAGGLLLASDFMWFVMSRIAMLDVFMASLVLVALWAFAGALRENETGRRRLAIAGMALGLAMAAKWSAVPLAVLPGIAFAAVRLRESGWRGFTSGRGAPVAGITIWEAALWLGLVPLAIYALTFVPAMFYAHDPLAPTGLVALHREMIHLQDSVVKPHPYQSVWYQWIVDWRAIWFLYENVDGAQRGILLVGNPLTMLLGLLALVWAGVYGFGEGRRDAAALVILYLVSLGAWILAGKPVQFYYHYLLPGTFLMGMLALALDSLWRSGWRKIALAVLAASLALFAGFYPILSAARLASPQSFAHWMWLDSWR